MTNQSTFKRTDNISCIGLVQSDFCERSVFCLRCYQCTDCEDCEECIDCHFCIQCFGLRGAAFRYRNKPITKDEFFVLTNHIVDNHVLRRIQNEYEDHCQDTRTVVFTRADEKKKRKIIKYYLNNRSKDIYIKISNGFIKFQKYEGQRGNEISVKDFNLQTEHELIGGFPYILYLCKDNIRGVLSFVTLVDKIDD